MRAPDTGRIRRFLAALPLSRRTIPAPAGQQRQQGESQGSWAGSGEKAGKDGWVSQPTHCCRDVHEYTHMELCTPKFPKKLISPGSTATTGSFLTGSLTERGFGCSFMPPFANSHKERPLGEWENQRRTFFSCFKVGINVINTQNSHGREEKYINGPWNNLGGKKLISRKTKP